MRRLKTAAICCMVSGTYPLWYWICRWQRFPDMTISGMLAVSLLLVIVAGQQKKLTKKIEQRSLFLADLLTSLISLLIGAGAWAVCEYLLDWKRAGAIVTGVLLMEIYHTAWRFLLRPAEGLLSINMLLFLCTMYFIGILLCLLHGDVYDISNFVVLAGSAGVFGFLRNRLMLRQAGDLPKKYYRHNNFLLMVFALPVVICFCFGRQITETTQRILKAIGQYLIRILRFLFLVLAGKDWLKPRQSFPAGELPEIDRNPVFTMILEILLSVFLLFSLIKFRLEILDFFRSVWQGIVSGMRRLLKIHAQEETEIRREYRDKSEILEPAGKTPLSRKSSWNRQYRNYLNIRNPSEQFRTGYGLWLMALQYWDIDLQSSDTPNRILEKSQGAPHPELTQEITKIYYRVRYHEDIPTPAETELLKKLLAQTKQSIKTVKK